MEKEKKGAANLLRGKIFITTGGTQGLGKEIALCLAQKRRKRAYYLRAQCAERHSFRTGHFAEMLFTMVR